MIRFFLNLLIYALVFIVFSVALYKIDESTPYVSDWRHRIPILSGPIDLVTGAGYLILTKVTVWAADPYAGRPHPPKPVVGGKSKPFDKAHPVMAQTVPLMGKAAHTVENGAIQLGGWLTVMGNTVYERWHPPLATKTLNHKPYYFVPNTPESLPIIRPEGIYIPIPEKPKPVEPIVHHHQAVHL